ncbi:MAG TPA: alpha/beta fold hydrolase [Thermoanaerobaculia bacterium]
MPEFTPPWWLRNAHVQTVFGRIVRPRRLVELERETIETPDGDELLLDHLAGDPETRLILMHGLEGSSNSVYMQGMLSAIARRGASATAINFRSCARDPKDLSRMLPNRRPRFYHSGETGDFDFVVNTLAKRSPSTMLLAAGASLGGNALLKWLGEHPGQTTIAAAATISVPYDLGAGAVHLEQSLAGRIYVNRFLNTLKEKVRAVAQKFPETNLDLDRIMRSRTFREFDDAATAPLHGFRDANDYYARSSSIHFLSKITTPALCISAEDDPFLPREALERARAAASPSVHFVTTPHGGHVGFVGESMTYWAEELAVEWLLARMKMRSQER